MKKSNKLILIINSSRGDYDILKPIIKIKKSKKLKIKTIATGSHFISTYSNFKIFSDIKLK